MWCFFTNTRLCKVPFFCLGLTELKITIAANIFSVSACVVLGVFTCNRPAISLYRIHSLVEIIVKSMRDKDDEYVWNGHTPQTQSHC